MKILVLGAAGMLGSAVFRTLGAYSRFEAVGTLRSSVVRGFFSESEKRRLVAGIDVLSPGCLTGLFDDIKPDVVVNCVGLIKQLAASHDPLLVLPLSSLLPHRLANHCEKNGARLIHISTDCVFSGLKGQYLETDTSDAQDLYGKSKFIGEVNGRSHAITLRTSIIGHGLESNDSLVDWFLAQRGSVTGFSRALFSGLPTTELARVIAEYVIPHPELSGLFHVAAKPIDKYSLLQLVAAKYEKNIDIVPDDKFAIDRSLVSSLFESATGYNPRPWPELVSQMWASQPARC